VRQAIRKTPREDSSDGSGDDLQVERPQGTGAPHIPSESHHHSTPGTGRLRLDVDAVLERSIRKVAGE